MLMQTAKGNYTLDDRDIDKAKREVRKLYEQTGQCYVAKADRTFIWVVSYRDHCCYPGDIIPGCEFGKRPDLDPAKKIETPTKVKA
jgi:hypothetical protein